MIIRLLLLIRVEFFRSFSLCAIKMKCWSREWMAGDHRDRPFLHFRRLNQISLRHAVPTLPPSVFAIHRAALRPPQRSTRESRNILHNNL